MRITSVLGMIAIALSQMGGCVGGNVGDGASFSVTTTRVSLASSGEEANGHCNSPRITPDGLSVLFLSTASNLAENGQAYVEVYVRDRVTGRTERISVPYVGIGGSGDSYQAAMSANGKLVAFQTRSLTITGSVGMGSTYLRDRDAGRSIVVSNDNDGFSGYCNGLAMTPDGRFVLYWRGQSGTTGNGTGALFLRDTQSTAPATKLVDPVGQSYQLPPAGISISANPSISADGRYIVYADGVGGLGPKVIVRWLDRVGPTTVAVSEKPGGGEPNADSVYAAMSENGEWVAFQSQASDILSPATTSNRAHVYIRRMLPAPESPILVSRNTSGGEANSGSYYPAISTDGRYVGYTSDASDLVPGDTNGTFDVFLWDRITGTTARVSVRSEGMEANTASLYSAVSSDGRYVVFSSDASNLVDGDTNFIRDIFVRGPLH